MAVYSPVRGFCNSVRLYRSYHAFSTSRFNTNSDVKLLKTVVEQNNSRKELKSSEKGLNEVAEYYFDDQSVALRPTVTLLMAKALNSHIHGRKRFSALGTKTSFNMAAYSPVRGFCNSVRLCRSYHASSTSRFNTNSEIKLLKTVVEENISGKNEEFSPTTAQVPHDLLQEACCACHSSVNETHQQRPMAAQFLHPSRVQTLGIRPESLPNPFHVAKDDVTNVFLNIKRELKSSEPGLNEVAEYYIDDQSIALRPTVTVLMAKALNNHIYGRKSVLIPKQRQIAAVVEMLTTATLFHDDIIDGSDTRNGRPSTGIAWGRKKSVLAGYYILSIFSGMLARIGNPDITIDMCQATKDLVQGEFMQRETIANENERFQHYLLKTFKKGGSLMGYGCKGVAIIAGGDSILQEVAFQYGKNLGIAWQLVEDILDFATNPSTAGKPTGKDLQQGMATAPVLFACEMYPELNSMITRRFSKPGDIEKVQEAVIKSDGIQKTKLLAYKYLVESVRLMQQVTDSLERRALAALTDMLLNKTECNHCIRM